MVGATWLILGMKCLLISQSYIPYMRSMSMDFFLIDLSCILLCCTVLSVLQAAFPSILFCPFLIPGELRSLNILFVVRQ